MANPFRRETCYANTCVRKNCVRRVRHSDAGVMRRQKRLIRECRLRFINENIQDLQKGQNFENGKAFFSILISFYCFLSSKALLSILLRSTIRATA